MKVVILAEAEQEAEDAALWYEERSPGLGYDFLAELRAGIERVIAHPTLQARVKSQVEGAEIRRRLLRRFPYMIVYQVIPNRIVILATTHLKRKPRYWSGRVEGE